MIHVINPITMLILVEINHIAFNAIRIILNTDIMAFRRTNMIHRLFDARTIAERLVIRHDFLLDWLHGDLRVSIDCNDLIEII